MFIQRVRQRAIYLLLFLLALTAFGANSAAAAPRPPLDRLPTTYYVDSVQGNDANAGTQAGPFKTIAKATQVATAGDTIQLAPGAYSKQFNGENLPLSIPAGVSLKGTLAEDLTSTILGQGGYGLLLKGDATVENLALTGFNTSLYASVGTQSLNHLFITTSTSNASGVYGTNVAQLTLNDTTINLPGAATGVQLGSQARVTMNGGTISGGAPNCRYGGNGFLAGQTSSATLNGVTLTNIPGPALNAGQGTAMTMNRSAIEFTLPDGCSTKTGAVMSGNATLSINGSTITGIGGTTTLGIDVNSGNLLSMSQTRVSGFKRAGIFANAGSKINLAFANGIIDNNEVGIDATGASASMTVTGSSFQNNTTGIASPALKLRATRMFGNGTAVKALGKQVDLGTAGDPGNNDLSANKLTGFTFGSSVSGAINASGNQWTPNVQGADSNGHYPAMLVDGLSSNAHGMNFDLPNATTKLQL